MKTYFEEKLGLKDSTSPYNVTITRYVHCLPRLQWQHSAAPSCFIQQNSSHLKNKHILQEQANF